MKRSCYYVFLMLFTVSMVLCTGTISAKDEPSKKKKKEDKIHITADKLITDNVERFADFIGKVKAVQGTAVITSNQLRIFYRKNDAKTKTDTEQDALNKDSVEKVVATGNVTIIMDGKIATSEKAEYTTDTAILILSGPKSKIQSDKNSVSGDKITLYRIEDRMIVESNADKRVEAIVYPGDKGLN